MTIGGTPTRVRLTLALASLLLASATASAQDAARAGVPLFDVGIGAGFMQPVLHGRAAEIWRTVGGLDAAPTAGIHFALGGERLRVGLNLGVAASRIGDHGATIIDGGVQLRWRPRIERWGVHPELQGGYSRMYIQVGHLHVDELPEVYEGKDVPPNRQQVYPRIFGNGFRGGLALLRPLNESLALTVTARSDYLSLTQLFTNPQPGATPLREPGSATVHALVLGVRWGR